MSRPRPASSGREGESGQALTEYILLLAAVVSFFFIVSSTLQRIRVAEKLAKPLQENFARAYQHGHPKAKGFDDGGPYMHPRVSGGDNFRIFINPEAN